MCPTLGPSQRALDLALHHSERGNQVYALRLRALLALLAAEDEPPNAPRARETSGRALALAESLQMRPLVARCHLGLGRTRAACWRRWA